MNLCVAKKFITVAGQNWGIERLLFHLEVAKMLDTRIDRKVSLYNEFEFSLNCFEKKLRLLHLDFYNPSISSGRIKAIRKRRVQNITAIVNYFNKTSQSRYNVGLLGDICSLVNSTVWPVQFGYAVGRNAQPIIKIYFSTLNSTDYCKTVIRDACSLLNLRWQKIKGNFVNKEFDALGLDFLPNGYCNLKIYPFYRPPFNLSAILRAYKRYQKNKDEYLKPYLAWIEKIPLRHIGFMYRVSKNSKIDSVKIWARLKKPTPPHLLPIVELRSVRLQRWLDSSAKVIESLKGNISYLTLEREKMGVYFR